MTKLFTSKRLANQKAKLNPRHKVRIVTDTPIKRYHVGTYAQFVRFNMSKQGRKLYEAEFSRTHDKAHKIGKYSSKRKRKK